MLAKYKNFDVILFWCFKKIARRFALHLSDAEPTAGVIYHYLKYICFS